MAPSALVCHTVADPYGDHHVGCGGNGDRIARHNSLRDAIFSAAQSAALAPRRKVSSLIPSSLSRPADVFTRPSHLGCNRHFDHATGHHPRCGHPPRSCCSGWGSEEIGSPMLMPVKLLVSPLFLLSWRPLGG